MDDSPFVVTPPSAHERSKRASIGFAAIGLTPETRFPTIAGARLSRLGRRQFGQEASKIIGEGVILGADAIGIERPLGRMAAMR